MRLSRVIVLLSFASILLASGCAGWKSTTRTVLNEAYAAANSGAALGKPYIHARCMEAAIACGQAGDTVCAAKALCQKNKDKFVTIVTSIYRAVLMGRIAIPAGDEATAKDWAFKALKLVVQLGALAQELGIDDFAKGVK